ncbi:MAG: hypothetical protein KatS3mg105_0747 [Gemmatales bacterium]|nr:MAG: hypothetical protein KatS3mg105_0747 [Gemmatales bacterium]
MENPVLSGPLAPSVTMAATERVPPTYMYAAPLSNHTRSVPPTMERNHGYYEFFLVPRERNGEDWRLWSRADAEKASLPLPMP